MKRALLGGKVARQVLVLFVLSALIPVLAIAVLSIRQVSDALIRQNHAHLNQAARDFGAGVFGRLQLIDQYLQAVARDPKQPSAVHSDMQSRVAGVAIMESSSQFVPLFGKLGAMPRLDDQAVKYLEGGGVLLLADTSLPQTESVFLIRAVDAPRTASFVVAEIKPNYLWGDIETFPYLTDFCVLRSAGTVLFCSKSLSQSALDQWRKQAATSPSATLAWRDGEDQIGSYWSLFLNAEFREDDWTILASMPVSEAFSALAAFRKSFVPIIGVSLLAACLLGATQICRTLVPLEKLIAGTRRLAAKDFAVPVEVGRRDEFGELADAFNGMAARLGQQFNALATFSEIDRVMLARAQVDYIVEMMLDRLPKVLPVDMASIIVLDGDNADIGKIFFQRYAAPPIKIAERVKLSVDDMQALLGNPAGSWVTKGSGAFASLMESHGADAMLTLPILWDGKPCGLLRLGYFEQPKLDDDQAGHMRDLADRLAVALSSAARDALLYKQAHYDALTGLPNRMLFMDRLAQELAHAERDGSKLALFFIDLDRFKTVNDTLGHASGDQLLRQASERLRMTIRKSDTLARLGGDEFTVILPKLATLRDVEVIANQVLYALSKPFEIGGVPHFLGASIGVAVYPIDGTTPEDLLRNADTAMYRAKDAGGGSHVYFEERMNQEATARLSLERELRNAIENDEFVIAYQPQWDLRLGKMCGAEALVRWNHPTRGLLSPAHFIACAEETGLIDTMGAVVMEKACAQYRQMHLNGIAPERISVNVSSRQFNQSNFVDMVGLVMNKFAIPPGALELEVTESVVMDDVNRVERSLTRLKKMGVRIAIDDFGTGYSSMAYLKRLPVDMIKIDRSFVIDITGDKDSQAIVRAIIALGHSLQKEVIAEGVETVEQRESLRAQGCDQIQGYLYSRPLLSEDFERFATMQLTRESTYQRS